MERSARLLCTDEEARFAEEYVVDFNKAAAARRANISENCAKEMGYRLFTRAHVRAYVEELKAQLLETSFLTKNFILTRLNDNLTRCMQLTEVLDREGKPTGEYKWEPHAANRALELMGKHLGMFEEKRDSEYPVAQIAVQAAVAIEEIRRFQQKHGDAQ